MSVLSQNGILNYQKGLVLWYEKQYYAVRDASIGSTRCFDWKYEKNRKNSFDVCSSFRAFALSTMPLSLRTSSYAQAIALIT